MGKEKNQKQEEKKSCECGNNCTCGDDCNCTSENKCNPDCTCGEHDHSCGCGEHCECGDDCHCDDHEHDCDCEHEFASRAEEFKAYQKAFDQFEKALEQVDRELTKEREKSARAEHLADTYKKDLDRVKERSKDIERESKINASIMMGEKILPILDNFEQALKTVKDENVMIGFKMIQSGIKNILADMDIVEMQDIEGKAFDPELHDAVNRIQTEDASLDGTIANVYKTGYIIKNTNKVIRHAQVEIYTKN
ncbi:MAG: nucleotide exchange factor GrpE [Clostridia bacterium]|nr:nucleotide exchange factor GrpE [Clostridia bacterium]